MIRRRCLVACLVLSSLLAAACSGGDDSSDDGTTTPTDSESVTTTTRPGSSTSTSTSTPRSTSTTAADDETDTTEVGGTSTTLVQTTTTVPAGPKYPLTGLTITDDTKGYRAALVVKIDNHPQARPQTGLNHADIVFEENVELLTRFAAVFQSDDADPVGPVRSGRTQDADLVASLTNPLFAWSGGNATVTRVIHNSPDLIDVSWTVAGAKGGYHRERSPGIDVEHATAVQELHAGVRTAAPAAVHLPRRGRGVQR